MFRSFIGALGAVLVLTPGAVLTSGTASIAAPPHDGYPSGTTLYPARLARGASTPLLHIAEEVIVDRGLRVPVRGVPHVWLLGRIGRQYLIQTANAGFDRYTVQLVRRDGSRRVLQRFGDATTPAISAGGERLALVTGQRAGTRIRVVRTRSGELVRERTFGTAGVEVSDYGVRRMVITGVRSRTFWWATETGRLTLIVARPAGADIAANRLVVSVPHPTQKLAECKKTVLLSRPSVVLWRSCKDRPLVFSPDGSRVATVPIESDGVGPSLVQVRRQDGTLLRTYRPPLFFGFVEWESDHLLLMQSVGKKYVAAVRCDVAGVCRRASRLYPGPGGLDPVTSMRWSFPQ